jgi:DNA repair exonuclease SbcCD ATPase subunit
MRAVAPAGINAFFTNLKDMWLERAPNLNGSQNYQNNSSAEIDKLNAKITSLQAQLAQLAQMHSQNNEVSADFEKLNSKISSLEAQLAKSMQVHSKIAQRLQLPENVVNSNNASIFDSYLNQELEKRLGVIEINLAKLTKLIREDTKSAQYRCSESSDYNNGGLEKRLEQIEAHLAKFARKDTKGTKTPQRQRSESLPFGGLEKRLGQIEALLAKLAKDSKSRSGRVHMATVDEQSDPIFSDDDTSKPEDNDYNSDSSSAGSDSGKRDMNIYITNGKKK